MSLTTVDYNMEERGPSLLPGNGRIPLSSVPDSLQKNGGLPCMCNSGQATATKIEMVKATGDREAEPVPSLQQCRILVVDDDDAVRETLTLLLAAAGYETTSAQNGFEALHQIKMNTPTLLLCDLEMPGMSGFELLSIVRRRFPQVLVIAMSGTNRGDSVPERAVADAFYSKGQQTPPILFRIVADMIWTADARRRARENAPAPVWGRRIGKDAQGISYVLLACEDCLRSFPVTLIAGSTRAVHEAHCVFCGSKIRYIADERAVDENCFRAVFSFLTQGQDAGISHDRVAPPTQEHR